MDSMSILVWFYGFYVDFSMSLLMLGRFLSISIKIAFGFMKIAALGGDVNESQCDFDRNR